MACPGSPGEQVWQLQSEPNQSSCSLLATSDCIDLMIAANHGDKWTQQIDELPMVKVDTIAASMSIQRILTSSTSSAHAAIDHSMGARLLPDLRVRQVETIHTKCGWIQRTAIDFSWVATKARWFHMMEDSIGVVGTTNQLLRFIIFLATTNFHTGSMRPNKTVGR